MQPQERRRWLLDGHLLFHLLHVDPDPLKQPRDEIPMIAEIPVEQLRGAAIHLAGRNGLLVERGAAEHANEPGGATEAPHVPQVLFMEFAQRGRVIGQRAGIVDVAESPHVRVARPSAGPEVTTGVYADQ